MSNKSLTTNHHKPQFYLASASPRRRALLAGVGLRFEVVAVEIDECHRQAEEPGQFVSRLSREKAIAAYTLIGERTDTVLPVLAADTCVTIDGNVLGKPVNERQAIDMLRRLSGRTHEVVTAVTLLLDTDAWNDISRTRVTFERLSPREIDAYCATGEPWDKAGAYAIQGLGCAFVKRIEGSYTGVVGLPMFETRCLLTHVGIDWL